MSRLMSVSLTEDAVRDRTKTVTRRVALGTITRSDVALEGFPDWSPAEFVGFFMDTHRGTSPESIVTRIEWRYVEVE